MTNQEISKILSEIGEYLEMQDVAFKPRAYQKVAETIAALSTEVSEIFEKGGLKAVEDIPGVGVSIAEKIEELLKTGKLKYYDQLKKKTPVDLAELSSVEGLGPKKIKVLYKELGIKNLSQLEAAAKAGKISKLEGFGAKTEENILRGIEFLKKTSGRFLLGEVLPLARMIVGRLKKIKGVERVEVGGSVRRYKETVGDADILVIAKHHKEVMDYFISMKEVDHVLSNGETKSAVKLKNGLQMDVRVLPRESYGAALNYFTGSKDHNVALRQLAIKHGMKLSEYGLFRRIKNQESRIAAAESKNILKDEEGEWERVAGKSEEELYEKLGMEYIPPEMREMTGEIDLALRQGEGKLPALPQIIGYEDLKGDLQTQSNWTDGANSILEMAEAAIASGLEYMAVTDHTKRLAMTHGLDEKRILKQMKEIDELNDKFKREGKKFRILKGTECDILEDGTMDLSDEILEQLDVVGGSVHSLFNLSKEKQTERICRAMRNKHVDIIFHPTGRLIGRRSAYEVDVLKIISVAKETGTVLEINAFPDRLDLKDEYIRKCVEAGVKLSIDSDAHSIAHFNVLEFGIGQARRGWATKDDVINAWSVEKMLKMFK